HAQPWPSKTGRRTQPR
ncbi:hypothetical protein CFC21_050864, partial [Triticum aestivum]